MSANFYGSPLNPRRRRPLATHDPDATADVHEEHTADLVPATVDIVPGEAPRPTLAAAPPPAPAEQLRPAPAIARDRAPQPPTSRAPVVAREIAPAPAVIVPPVINEPRIQADAPQDGKPKPGTPFVRREPFVSAPTPTPVVAAAPAPATRIATDTVDVQPLAKSTAPPLAADVPPVRKPTLVKPAEPVVQRVALAPGKVLCDRYLLEQVIGCGGTAIVFRARDMLSAKGTAHNMLVAIKTPRPELRDTAKAAMRLKHEFEHARLLSHPSIVRVFDLQEDAGQPFLTMELVEGRLLSGLLRDWTMLPASLAYKILGQCAEALQYAHSRDVVHGDFKPGNVFITPDEGVRIMDFGTAAGPTANDSRIPAGTPTYASPEVLEGETPDRRDDVFSFACVAYEVLTGQHPFGRLSSLQARDEGKIPPRAWNLSTPQWLSLLSALSWKREQRPANVEDLVARLNAEQAAVAPLAPIHVDPEELVPAELPADLMPKQRSWGFFAFIACAVLVTYWATQRQNTPDRPGAPAPAALAPAATTLPPTSVPVPPAAAIPAATTEATGSEDQAATAIPTATAAAVPVVAARSERRAAPMSDIAFEASSIVTSESSVAAVFLIKRSQPLNGRVTVSWKTSSGTADAGIDFASSASGTVTFADGQAQRAIYVPLRNDLLKEDDEAFTVELLSPQSARLGKAARAQAIIRDDD
jgi:tRNA A-37 threonylcarbamoyl transferase component Bud32